MPTATDRDFLDMQVCDVRRIAHAGQDSYVVLLQERESDRRLPIWIGGEHAIELALRLLGYGSQLPRPLSSDLSARLVQALGGTVREVRIDRLSEGTYYAVIVVDGPQGATEVDARPSDALPLAVIDRQEAAGPQALLDELAQEAQRQDPPEASSS
jgi:bifunctional DNase/RNase